MTKIKVKAKKQWSTAERQLAKAAIHFALGELDLGVAPIPIHIHLKGAHKEDFGDSIDLEHKIVIRLYKGVNWLRTLFHELEHARQYIYCELELETDHAIWHGELRTRNEDDYEEYWESPWEVAAREKERELFTAFQKNLLTSSS
ncbi:MAG: hypothetical protein ACO3N9_11355 [Alphaproteobacteria bacterium]